MYEQEKAMAAQGLGYAGSQNAAVDQRPSGSVRSQVEHLSQMLDGMDGTQRRMRVLMDKLLVPRPEPVNKQTAGQLESAQSSVESRMAAVLSQAERLMAGFNEIADRLDGAV